MKKNVTNEELQMAANKYLAKKLNSDEKTAFLMASQVKRRITVAISNNLFTSLVIFCYKIGIGNFSNSLVLKMVNAQSKKTDIDKMLKMTITNFS